MMMLNDGRSELWQWDTGRKLTVDADCSQIHFSNKVFGRSVDVDVVDGVANIPDILLQTDKDLSVWAFVGTPENGYTKISKVFKVNRRNKPADYVFTPPEQTTLGELVERLEKIEESQDPDAIKNAVEDYLQNNPIRVDEKDPTVPVWAKQPTKPKYTADEVGAVATVNGISPDENGNVEIPVSGGNAENGEDGFSPIAKVEQTANGAVISITDKDGTTTATITNGKDGKDGADGQPGKDGADGVSATHSWNGTVLTVTSASGTSSADLKGATGNPGKDGSNGQPGADGVSPTVAVSKSGKVTTVAITDKNGTKTATINDGANGTSVTVKSVSESTADGGSNVVTFSDGKTLTVKNGSKGSKGDKGDTGATGAPGANGSNGVDGKTPVRGTDYWTEADKAEIKSYVDEAILGGAW